MPWQCSVQCSETEHHCDVMLRRQGSIRDMCAIKTSLILLFFWVISSQQRNCTPLELSSGFFFVDFEVSSPGMSTFYKKLTEREFLEGALLLCCWHVIRLFEILRNIYFEFFPIYKTETAKQGRDSCLEII